MPLKTSSGKWKWGNIERKTKGELVQVVYGIWKKNGSPGSFSSFWHGKHVKESSDKYERPWSLDEIKANLPELYSELSKDPVHRWRAETGIELIHKEPSRKELNRIWKNWNLMDDEMKSISDKKSLELFGMKNKEHFQKLSEEKFLTFSKFLEKFC